MSDVGMRNEGNAGNPLGFEHRFIPGGSGRTVLLLHGTGGDENDLLPLGEQLAPDANLLSPRGKVLEGGMPRFFRRLAMGVFDEADLKFRAHELMDFVDLAAKEYGFDRANVTALGYSNGANIAAAVLLLRPGALRAAGLLHAMVPFEPEELPDLTGTSVLLTGGRRDAMIPAPQTERLAQLLTEAGADLTLAWQPGGHELTPAELATVSRFYVKIQTA